MFCYQCEQTARGTGCTVQGVCGKTHDASEHMDVLLYMVKGIGRMAHRAREKGAKDPEVDAFVMDALFTTITNVSFDVDSLRGMVMKALEVRARARGLLESAGGEASTEALGGIVDFDPGQTSEEIISRGEALLFPNRRDKYGLDAAGLQELILYGLKGLSAYGHHARVLGVESEEVYAFVHEALDFLAGEPDDIDALVKMAMRTGEANYKAMEALDKANTETYGHPEPTKVRLTPLKGKCILVSGHDLKDLDEILRQTEGMGINVYTHGEMLPCHGYPGLKKYGHLAGNYGGAWQNQRQEFDEFPGAILMTTNCIQKPQAGYVDRIFTTSLVSYPGVKHVNGPDFSPVIEAALAAIGFEEDGEEKYITVGFGREAVLGVADKVVSAVRAGVIKHFFLIGGCDGARAGRNYYTEFAQNVPVDCIILTLACGKYRFNKLDFGEIDGIPRLLDIGQCNDAYSAIRIATTLAEAFDCGVNDLPLSLVLSWYEQKAVAVLLTLLSLGIKDIRLGPTLPAFVGPEVLQVLVDKFDIKPTTTPEEDLKDILG